MKIPHRFRSACWGLAATLLAGCAGSDPTPVSSPDADEAAVPGTAEQHYEAQLVVIGFQFAMTAMSRDGLSFADLAALTTPCPGGGSREEDAEGADSTMEFVDCRMADGRLVNGRLTFSADSIVYEDLRSVGPDGDVSSIDGTYRATADAATGGERWTVTLSTRYTIDGVAITGQLTGHTVLKDGLHNGSISYATDRPVYVDAGPDTPLTCAFADKTELELLSFFIRDFENIKTSPLAGLCPPPVPLDAAPDPTPAPDVVTPPPGDTDDPRPPNEATIVYEGWVSDSEQVAVPGATVSAKDASGTSLGSATTDSAGEYELVLTVPRSAGDSDRTGEFWGTTHILAAEHGSLATVTKRTTPGIAHAQLDSGKAIEERAGFTMKPRNTYCQGDFEAFDLLRFGEVPWDEEFPGQPDTWHANEAALICLSGAVARPTIDVDPALLANGKARMAVYQVTASNPQGIPLNKVKLWESELQVPPWTYGAATSLHPDAPDLLNDGTSYVAEVNQFNGASLLFRLR